MRTIDPGTQVFEINGTQPMQVETVELDGTFRCWRWAPDGSGKRIKRWFTADELETTGERNRRCAEEEKARTEDEDRLAGRTKPRRPLYDV